MVPILKRNWSYIFYLKIILFLIFETESSQTDCRAEGQVGTCISVRDCPIVSTILQQSRDQAIAYLRRNHCGFDGMNPLVCCIGNANVNTRPGGGVTNPGNPGSNSGLNPQPSVSPPTENTQVDPSSNPLLPSDCGRDLTQRIVGGERTELGEFPWMALLEYQKREFWQKENR